MRRELITQSGNNLVTHTGAKLIAQGAAPPVQPEPPPLAIGPFDTAALRHRVGIDNADASRDADIVGVMKMAIEFAERYCDRKFAYKADEVEQFAFLRSPSLSLRRYPIETIDKINDQNVTNRIYGHQVNSERGLVYFDHYIFPKELTVTYAGGYRDDEWPADLLMALLSIFDSVWFGMFEANNATQTTGAIKTIKAGDLSLTYDTASNGGAINGGEFVPPMAAAILNYYVRERA